MSRRGQQGGRARRNQRGNTILAVSAIGAAATLVMTAVMNNTVLLEERAIDAHLAETRAYWGAMGHFRYAISRLRFSEACDQDWGCNGGDEATDDQKAAALQAYLDEIESLREFTYREESDNYVLALDLTALADDTPGRDDYSGHVMMRSAMAADQGDLPLLNDNAANLPGYEMRLCVGLQNWWSDCGDIDDDNGGRYTDEYSVKRLARRAGN